MIKLVILVLSWFILLWSSFYFGYLLKVGNCISILPDAWYTYPYVITCTLILTYLFLYITISIIIKEISKD